jgi:phospho-N-acetylmuramoyl-pentapeptide-transferase
LQLRQRIVLVAILSFVIGFWFYDKLGIDSIRIFLWELNLSAVTLPFDIPGALLIIPIVMFVLLGLFGSSVIDGFDGITIGTLLPVYMCFAGLSFAYGFYDIATFMMVMVGSMIAYLWYNIPPAKFVLGDTGSASVLLTLGTVAFLIDAVDILPIAGLMLFLTLGSNVIQVASKKILKRKILLAAPLHHHFEAIGWTREQTTMRYWLISMLTSGLALAIGLLLK